MGHIVTPPDHPPPLVVGGTGGSGTRVVARILMHGGRYMGAERNPEEDALAFRMFDYRWSPAVIAAHTTGVDLPGEDLAAMRAQFDLCRDRHRATIPDPGMPWGWKHPLSAHLLPFLHGVYPELRFVHVIRDGRDFAIRDSGGAVAHAVRLGRAVLAGDATPLQAGSPAFQSRWRVPGGGMMPSPANMALFWARVNIDCADYGEARLGDRYLRVRLEDLCARPDEELRRLYSFTETEVDLGGIREAIQTPASIGGWRDRDAADIRAVVAAAGSALSRFGYGDAP